MARDIVTALPELGESSRRALKPPALMLDTPRLPEGGEDHGHVANLIAALR